jgi:hypothetical protein
MAPSTQDRVGVEARLGKLCHMNRLDLKLNKINISRLARNGPVKAAPHLQQWLAENSA